MGLQVVGEGERTIPDVVGLGEGISGEIGGERGKGEERWEESELRYPQRIVSYEAEVEGLPVEESVACIGKGFCEWEVVFGFLEEGCV